MGHGITSTDSTFSVREMPWMGLLNGEVKVLDDYPTREVAQATAHPWEAIETPVFRRVIEMTDEGPVAKFEEIEEEKELVRSDGKGHLGVVSATRGLVSINDMYDVAEAVEGADGQVRYETAGSLNGGRQVWVLLRFNDPIVVKGDPNGGVIPFFAIQGGFTRDSGAFRGQAIKTRIVCANTSTGADIEARKSGYEFTFRHSSRVADRIEEAKAAVTLWRESVGVWQNAMEHLIQIKVTPSQREDFVQRFQPMPPKALITDLVERNVERSRAELRAILDGPTSEGIDLTAYGLAQAGLEWSQHYRRTRTTDPVARMETHFKRAMMPDAKLGRSIFALAQEVASV